MSLVQNEEDFFKAASAWVHQSSSVVICYLILQTVDGPMRLCGLSVVCGPRPVDEELCFSVATPSVLAGQIHWNTQNSADVISLLHDAARGAFSLNSVRYTFRSGATQYSTGLEDEDTWAYDLHLRVKGQRSSILEIDFATANRSLRVADIPFDGLADLTAWLGLANPTKENFVPAVDLRIRPPIDCIVANSHLVNDELTVFLASHVSLDASLLRVAVRAVPGTGISGRRQVAEMIEWVPFNAFTNTGTAKIPMTNADSALIMVSFAGKTVRRQWFIDPVKARNSRAVACRYFDTDLRQVRRALLDGADSPRFELAVCSLMFMLGFAAAAQLETDSPDIIATTPAGRLILVECTLKTSDFRTKVGKLVDRRNALTAHLAKASHSLKVHSVLVCRTPRKQIVVNETELRELNVHLIAQEDVERLLDQVNLPYDPDAFFVRAEEASDGLVG